TATLVPVLPAASFAIAFSVCVPLLVVVVFHEIVYGAVVSRVPRLAPSNWNCTLATPTLSEAVAVTLRVPETVVPLAGPVTETVGGVVSGTELFTVTVIAVLVAELPAPSVATARQLCVPLVDLVLSHDKEYGDANIAAPKFAPSSWNCTLATLTLSVA